VSASISALPLYALTRSGRRKELPVASPKCCEQPMRLQRTIGTLLCAVACTGCVFFEEASFELGRGSALPVWLAPEEVPSQARITITRYTNNYVSIDVFGAGLEPIKHLSGWYRSHPTFDERGPRMCFPMYFYVDVNDKPQLFEQRAPEPFVYVAESVSDSCTVQFPSL
jgi:hypothetical protein